MSEPLPAPAASNTFERIKRVNSEGLESWSARDLARVLEYLNFRNFQPVIEKAKEACAKSGHAVADHFAEMRNMVGIGSGAQREVEDCIWETSLRPRRSLRLCVEVRALNRIVTPHRSASPTARCSAYCAWLNCATTAR